MTVMAYIGFGSNLGDLTANLKTARQKLDNHPQISVRRSSRLYRSEPLTPDQEDQPWYLNAVFEITTELTLHQLFTFLKQIERAMGRRQIKRWASRIVDLDILFYGTAIYQDNLITVPHAEMINRMFVLKPLCDLIPDFLHPDIELPLRDILAHCDDTLITEAIVPSIAITTDTLNNHV